MSTHNYAPGINVEGAEKMLALMEANSEMFDQSTFGDRNECGTEMCQAGFCRAVEVGIVDFNKEVGSPDLAYLALASFTRVTGVDGRDINITDPARCWPEYWKFPFSGAERSERVALVARMWREGYVQADGSITVPEGDK